MKKVLCALAAFFAFSAPVLAAPRIEAASAVRSGETLLVSFDARGLGNDDIVVTAAATVHVIERCRNRGGHFPPGHTEGTMTVAHAETFEVKNGRVQGVIVLEAPPLGHACPPPLTLVRDVTFSQVVVSGVGDPVAVPGTF